MVSTHLGTAHPARTIDAAAPRPRLAASSDVLATMMQVGDPLADAVVAERVPRQMIDDALHQRRPSSQVPESLAALHAQLKTVPDWLEIDRLHRGTLAYLGIGATWMQLLLGPGSLINTYRSPGIAVVLTASGRLDTTAAARRISETGAWLGSAVQPGHLRVGAPGFVATAQVRLLHAHVRHHVGGRDAWDSGRWGVPINQLNLARTLLDFTTVPMGALRRLGVGLTADQRDDVYHLFRYIGYLLGLDPILDVDDHDEANALADRLDAFDGPPDENSRALVGALLSAYDELLSPVIHTPPPVTRQLVLALARAFHGSELCRSVGIARPAPWAVLGVRALGLANSAARLVHRAVPAARRRAVRRTIGDIRSHEGTLEGDILYESGSSRGER